jgi:hypothetical protein
MKTTFKLLALIFTLFINAQIKDLAEMSSGDIVNFQSVFDNEGKLYGYFTLYNLGKVSENYKKFEYVLLDKNLNKVSSNTFEGEKVLYTYTAYLDINRDLIIAPYLDYNEMSVWGIGKFVYPEYKKIDLKNNKIEVYLGKCFENNKFTTCEPNKSFRESRKDTKAEKKAKGYIVVRQHKDYDKYVKDNIIRYFDENEKEIWKYEYNNFADKKNSERIMTLDVDDNAFYGIKTIKKDKESTYHLLVLDIKDGKVLAENQITGLDDDTL